MEIRHFLAREFQQSASLSPPSLTLTWVAQCTLWWTTRLGSPLSGTMQGGSTLVIVYWVMQDVACVYATQIAGYYYVACVQQVWLCTFCRSSRYCSDISKMVGCPVIHVNGDYPEVRWVTLHVPLVYQARPSLTLHKSKRGSSRCLLDADQSDPFWDSIATPGFSIQYQYWCSFKVAD